MTKKLSPKASPLHQTRYRHTTKKLFLMMIHLMPSLPYRTSQATTKRQLWRILHRELPVCQNICEIASWPSTRFSSRVVRTKVELPSQMTTSSLSIPFEMTKAVHQPMLRRVHANKTISTMPLKRKPLLKKLLSWMERLLLKKRFPVTIRATWNSPLQRQKLELLLLILVQKPLRQQPIWQILLRLLQVYSVVACLPTSPCTSPMTTILQSWFEIEACPMTT